MLADKLTRLSPPASYAKPDPPATIEPYVTSSSTHSLLEEPLEDLLLALEAREESAELRVQTGVGPASVSVAAGRLSGAAFGPWVGPEAVKHLLSHRDGTYLLDVSTQGGGPGASEVRSLPQFHDIIREKGTKSTRIGASSQRPSMRVQSVLVRTAKALPSGLSAVELRALASVDGRSSVLGMIRTLRDPAAESLQAFRRLLSVGLVSEGATASYSPTLSMGTNQSLALGGLSSSSGSTSLIHARRITPVSAEARKGDDRPPITNQAPPPDEPAPDEPAPDEPALDEPALDPDQEQLKRKATGRWAKSPEKRVRLKSTGYSSVPPASLATEQVALPRSRREKDEPVPAASSTALGAFSGERDDDEGEHIPLMLLRRHPIEPKRHDTPTALSAATARAERTFPEQRYELRESEIPVPSSRLDSATLEQLDELNAAVRSSRRPDLPEFSASVRPPSSKGGPPPDSGPPPSLGLGIPLGELPSPGSVPYPQELPGDTAEDSTSGLPRVGRYEVLARLKRGGMGSVYMCRLSGTAGFRRLFAMKVLHGHLAAQSESLEAFFHEARVLGELHHPNIVGIADVGTPQEPYIVMDYVEGGSLAELFRATAAGRDPALTVTIVLDALNGLSYAHSALDDNSEPLELVHHDVTPHNLLVGIDGSCRVTDFGIARTKKEAGDPSVVQGKPAYLAPERLRHAAADHRADVFSMGVVLYLGLTGVEPFRGATAEETTQLILHGKVVAPSEVGFGPPAALDWICMTALAQEPDARFSSAQEMAAQLRRVAESAGLIAPAADVAAWVRASLGPTLAARRAASMRGTGTTEPPPSVILQKHLQEEARQVPSDAPSAAETTGPLESSAYDENTEVLTTKNPSSLEGEREEPRRRYLAYAALFVALAVFTWAMIDPDRAGKLFGPSAPGPSALDPASAHTPPGSRQAGPPSAEQSGLSSADSAAPDKASADSAAPGSSAAPGTNARTPAPGGKKIEIDEDGYVVLPSIQRSGDK